MNKYKRINNITGWIIFAIATVTYMLTLEPTTSWWDCGEYIATASKLQVGHPPGAPTFQLLGSFFSLFAFGNVEKVALMINIMSGLCSSFTILFLFWTITMLARKVIAPNIAIEQLGNKENSIKMWYIMAAGAIGALAYTFSDTFWFSAVEGEVYAMSSLCTAIVFWAILKWDLNDNERDADRWIIFISFIIGLSIGVHLLNLLTITAVSLVVYYKIKDKPTVWGTILTILLSFVIIAIILFLIIPLLVKLAGYFELFFVNKVGLPFNAGTIIYFVLLTAIIALAWFFTVKKKSTLWNTVVISFVYLLIGYSTFFIIVIRAKTNTPINEGSPSDALSLLSYLNREQYGDTPLVYGNYYNAPVEDVKPGNKAYAKDIKTGKYIVTDDGTVTTVKPVYYKDFCTIFPRMHSSDQRHVEAYKDWGNIKGRPIQVPSQGGNQILYKPTFAENLRFFFSYQVNHMYFRYFMWNFVGRQNNIEGHGDLANGNWISGINFLDSMRLGDQKSKPDSLKKNPSRNTFFFLPLIIGLIGMFYHFRKNSYNALIVLWLFIMTGLAIVVYLNQTPYQPRERDYAYAASFYAFAIWIGFGVLGISNMFKKIIKNEKANLAITFSICLFAAPVLMAQQGWDDHNRSGKYAACDFAKNYLTGCLPNSVLICTGDNDTFPLWYVQEVEGYRTDVRVVNFMLSASDWYAHQMMRKVYDSEKLPLTLEKEDYYKGVNDIIFYRPLNNNPSATADISSYIKLLKKGSFQYNQREGKPINTFPLKRFSLKVNKEKCLKNGIVPPEYADYIVDEIVWDVEANNLYKNDLLLFDFIATFDWDRPLYFTNPQTVKGSFNVIDYCYLDGIVYRFMPVILPDSLNQNILGRKELGNVDFENSYKLLGEEYTEWGNLNNEKVVVDRESERNSNMVRQNFYRAALALANNNRPDSAALIIDKAMEYFPDDKIPLEYWHKSYAEVYYKAGQIEKGNEIIRKLFDKYYNETNYYLSLKPKFCAYYQEDAYLNISILYALINDVQTFNSGDTEFIQELTDKFTFASEMFQTRYNIQL
ncbi:MAG: protein O-mannosyl-transferase family [Bacteroidales bacterium]|jgi:hypothetical protein